MNIFFRRNQKVAAWILGIVAVYYFFQFKDFSWDLKIMLFPLVKFIVFIFGFISVFFLKVKWFVKTITLLFYIILIATSYEIGLIKLSMINYFDGKELEFNRIVSIVHRCPEPIWFDFNGKNTTDKLLDSKIKPLDRKEIVRFLRKSDVIEILADKKNVLFVFSRFIDNGYGFMYVDKNDSAKVKEINYLQIVNFSHLTGHWYFVSFT